MIALKEPCEDCISREQAIKATYGFERYTGIDEAPYEYAESILRELPSVTPTRKKGKWIGTCQVGFGEFAEYEVELIDGFVADNCHCGECGEELEKGERGIYCPNCGCFMSEGG